MHNDFSSRVSLIASIVLHKPYLSKEMLSFAFTIYRLAQKKWHNFQSVTKFYQGCVALWNFTPVNLNMFLASIYLSF